jgi:hypothetical protein
LASLSARKNIGNSRYGTGDAAALAEESQEFTNINVTKVQWFDAPLSGAGAVTGFGNTILGWKHSLLILQCDWAYPGAEKFDLILEKCEVGDDCDFPTVGTNSCLLLSHGGEQQVTPHGGKLTKHCKPPVMNLSPHETVSLRAIIDVAEKTGPYIFEENNCQHMVLDVFNLIRQRKNMAPLKETNMPNARQLKAASFVGKQFLKIPGLESKAGCGPSTVKCDVQYGQSKAEGPCGSTVTHTVKRRHAAAIVASGAGLFAGAVGGAAVSGTPAVIAAAAAATVAAKAAAEKVALKGERRGHAFEQPDPCDGCGGPTAAVRCEQCNSSLCRSCANFPKHRKHQVSPLKAAAKKSAWSGAGC